MGKNWTGNKNSIYKTLGASNHTKEDREENDYYATDPIAIDLLLKEEKFKKNIWEISCGQGHLSKRLKEKGYNVFSSDIIDRGYNETYIIDFLKYNKKIKKDIITNPPYKYAQEFIEKSISLISNNNKIAMFLKLQFLEGKKRKKMFKKFPPKIIYVSSGRIICAKNGEFKKVKSSAVAYCWFIWEKNFKGNPIIKWIN